MKTVTDSLTEMAFAVKVAGKDLLLNHSSLKETEVIGPDHRWQPLSPEGERIRSKLHEDNQRFNGLLAALLHAQTPSVCEKLERASKTVRAFINQQGFATVRTTAKASEHFERAVDEQLALLAALYSGADSEHIYVPDTNALLHNPQLEDWRFDGSPQFVLILTPTVLSELDKLKVAGKDTVKEKAERLTRQFKEYRRRGNLHDGVTLRQNSHSIRTVAVEPDFRHTLPWLDPQNQDDRILASTVEIMRKYPRCTVVLVTRDTNLTNKADFAGLPSVEPLDPPKPGQPNNVTTNARRLIVVLAACR